jgi:geranylgeranyl diphosphate synthase type II
MPPQLITYTKWLEAEIKKQQYGKKPASLYEPIRYLMALGGKRLRPMLTLLSYSLYRSDVREIVPFAVAVEAFHNFTLMHDDIMDKAPLRRGKATVHKKWNVNTAILSGDVMLVKVYDMFLDIPKDKITTVLRAFNKCAAEVCEGQQWDMAFETQNGITEAQYIQMIKLKTAVLLGFSLELGAILGGAPEADRKALREFGVNIGIGFQLKDDLLDAYGDPKKFGKQVGGDITANKKTYLLIKAIERAKGETKKELTAWISEKRSGKLDKIKSVKNIYDALDIPYLTEKKVNQFYNKGFSSFENVKANPAKKEILKHFAENLIKRQS